MMMKMKILDLNQRPKNQLFRTKLNQKIVRKVYLMMIKIKVQDLERRLRNSRLKNLFLKQKLLNLLNKKKQYQQKKDSLVMTHKMMTVPNCKRNQHKKSNNQKLRKLFRFDRKHQFKNYRLSINCKRKVKKGFLMIVKNRRILLARRKL